MFHVVDNVIYLEEVACIRDILESIVSEIVCRGVDENVPDEVVHEVHMQDDGQGQGVEDHDQQQGLHSEGGELTGSLVEGDH